MHEAQIDGAIINVSIVLPRRKLSPAPPVASRGANIDPRVPFTGGRGSGPSGYGSSGRLNVGGGGGGGGRRHTPSSSRFGPRSDVYRPGSRSLSRSRSPPPALGSRAGGSRYRSRSRDSYISRSRSPTPKRRDGGRSDEYASGRRGRSLSYTDRSMSRSRSRSRE
jgi:RNA-binding protein with serine-rich domain 1